MNKYRIDPDDGSPELPPDVPPTVPTKPE